MKKTNPRRSAQKRTRLFFPAPHPTTTLKLIALMAITMGHILAHAQIEIIAKNPLSAVVGTNKDGSLLVVALPESVNPLPIERECPQGDINGDGDFNDTAHAIFDYQNDHCFPFGVGIRRLTPEIVGSSYVFAISEFRNNLDYNGDGDTTDEVIQIYDHQTGSVINTGITQPNFSTLTLVGDDSAILISVHEQQVNMDLNDDGTLDDTVTLQYDFASASFKNLGYVGTPIAEVGDSIYTIVLESFIQQDLDGNGTIIGGVLHELTLSTGELSNLGIRFDGTFTIETISANFQLRRLLATAPVEASYESKFDTDFNSDGDLDDYVVRYYDTMSHQMINTGLAVHGPANGTNFRIKAQGHLLSIVVDETAQGETDLNGDGVLHRVAHAHNLITGETVIYGTHYHGNIEGDLVAGPLDRTSNGIQIYDFATGFTTILESGSPTPGFSHGRLIYKVLESRVGTDLNGDGDLRDSVPHVYDYATGNITNTGFADHSFSRDIPPVGDLLIITVSEEEHGETDLNDDGDATDVVLRLYDLATGISVNTGLSGHVLSVTSDKVIMTANEAMPNGDLNGDGLFTSIPVIINVTEIIADPIEVIEDLTEIVNDLELADSVETSLSAQLDAALRSLETDNPAEADSTCEQLAAFIRSVESQRGKRLTDDQATELVESTQATQEKLGCIEP